MRRLGDRPAALIEALHAAQEAFGYLDDDALNFVGDTLGVPHSRVYGVATFYSFFTLKPQGEHTCVVCTGTACYINGAKEILAGARPGARRQAQADDRGRQGVAPDGALPRRLQPGAGRHRRRRGRRARSARERARCPAGGDVSEMPAAARPIRRRVITEEVPGGPAARVRARVRGRQLHVGASRTTSRSASASAAGEPASATSRSSASAAWASAPPGRSSRSPRPASSSSASARTTSSRHRQGPQEGQADRHPPAAGPLLREAGPGRHRELRADRPGEPRRLHRAGRLRGAAARPRPR